MGKASGSPLRSRSITSSSDRLGMRRMETPKADAAGPGTRDWFSIMQRFVSGQPANGKPGRTPALLYAWAPAGLYQRKRKKLGERESVLVADLLQNGEVTRVP